MPQFLLAGSLPRFSNGGARVGAGSGGRDDTGKTAALFFRRSDGAAVEHRGKIEGKRRE